MQEPSDRARTFVARAKRSKHLHSASVFREIHDLARTEPRQLAPLLKLCLEKLSRGGTYFDAGLALVSEEELGELVAKAVELLRAEPGHKAAADCIAYGALQVPESLAGHLRSLFDLRPNVRSYYTCWPWRASRPDDVAFLREVAADEARDEEDRVFAWSCLLETGRHDAVLAAVTNPPPLAHPLEVYLEEVGFQWADGVLRFLPPEVCFHLRFPDEYLAAFSDPPWRPKDIEPTWSLPAAGCAETRVGGAHAAACAGCGGQLHRLVELEPVPPGLGVESVGRLDLVTCLSCLGWEKELLFFRHGDDGRVEALAAGATVTPEFPGGPLAEVTARLVPTPSRWLRQDWGMSNSRESLHRVGGHPTWIQSAQYPQCPGCGTKMGFLLQLDSELPLADGDGLMWGSGGIGYFFWCDPCRTSGGYWQCT